MKAILQLLLCLFPCILAGVPPYYYYNQPPQDAYYQYAPVVAQAPQGAFQYTNFHNGSASYSPPEIRTECQAGSYCTVDMFCDVNVTISSVPLNLTEEEKDDRGELIPCWHVETQEIQVCCNPPSDEPKENVKSEDLKDFATCPRVPRAFSESSCSDVASTCASVGKPDQSCLNNELCCYDGCANRCISDLSPEPVEETSPSEAVSNFLSGSNSHSYSALPYRHSYYHPTPYAAPSYHHSASYAPRPFKAIFPQSPSYSIRTSGSVSSSTPKPNSVEVALPSYPTTQSPPSPAYPRYPSYSQSTIYKPEKTGSPYSSYSHSYSNSQSFGYSRPASTAAHTHEALTQAEAYHSPSPATQASPYHSPTPVPQEHPYTPQQQSSPYSYRVK
uniref:Inactive serine protease scarface clip-domain domain-containing protein n=1 Tax=Lepeophtheirus salmonis TaxID=72036 RepID=A0A0K2SVS4_LEPSM